MSTPRPIRLEIPPEALPAVTFALQRTIDDLEARALIATDHDPDLGPASAAEYRADIGRLAELAGQLGHTPGRPDPERAAVVWGDGVYTIEHGRPKRMTATVRLSRLLGEAIDARREGRISPSALIELVAEATGTATLETAEQLETAHQLARRADARPTVKPRKVSPVPKRWPDERLPDPPERARTRPERGHLAGVFGSGAQHSRAGSQTCTPDAGVPQDGAWLPACTPTDAANRCPNSTTEAPFAGLAPRPYGIGPTADRWGNEPTTDPPSG